MLIYQRLNNGQQLTGLASKFWNSHIFGPLAMDEPSYERRPPFIATVVFFPKHQKKGILGK